MRLVVLAEHGKPAETRRFLATQINNELEIDVDDLIFVGMIELNGALPVLYIPRSGKQGAKRRHFEIKKKAGV